MSTTISIVIFPNAKQWLRENLPDMFTDRVASVLPYNKPASVDRDTKYCDSEEDTEKICTPADHVRALKQLCEQIGHTLFVGCLTSPKQLLDADNWDAEVVDAYFQLVYHGEVIYG